MIVGPGSRDRAPTFFSVIQTKNAYTIFISKPETLVGKNQPQFLPPTLIEPQGRRSSCTRAAEPLPAPREAGSPAPPSPPRGHRMRVPDFPGDGGIPVRLPQLGGKRRREGPVLGGVVGRSVLSGAMLAARLWLSRIGMR